MEDFGNNLRFRRAQSHARRRLAQVVKLVDAGDSKSPAARRAGSIPALGTSRHRSIAVTPPMLTATPAAGPAPLCRPAAIEPRLTLQRGAFSYAPAATRRTFPPPVGRRISNAARDSNRFLPTKPSARPPKSFAIGKRSRPTHRHKYDDYPSTNVRKIPIDASSVFYPFKTHAHRSARCRDRAASDWAASSRSTAAHTRSA